MDLDAIEAASDARRSHFISELDRMRENLDIVTSLRNRLRIESDQNKVNAHEAEKRLVHPICRYPTAEERKHMHFVKSREAELAIQIMDAEGEWDRFERMRVELEEKLVDEGCDAKFAELGVWKQTSRNRLNPYENGASDLPMLVGRNLSKTIDPFVAKPEKTYDIVLQASQFKLMQAEVEETLLRHKVMVRADKGLFRSGLERMNVQGELNRLETAAARARQRLEGEKKRNLRSDLNDAVTNFWAIGLPLEEVKAYPEPPGVSEIVDKHTNRMLSRYVKHVRQDKVVGQGRVTHLLSELISATDADTEHYDSGILLGVSAKPHTIRISLHRRGSSSGTGGVGPKVSMRTRMNRNSVGGAKCFKRYKKEAFISEVKGEILKVIASLEKAGDGKRELGMEPHGSGAAAKLTGDNKDCSKFRTGSSTCSRLRLAESESDYIYRKRDQCRSEIHAATDLQGCLIEILDGPCRGGAVVGECEIEWRDNGTVPIITHHMRMAGGDLNDTGEELRLDLRNYCYFVMHKPEEKEGKGQIHLAAGNRRASIRIPSIMNFADAFSEKSQIEKERWEMSQTQDRFYDLAVTRGVYKLGLRHNTLALNGMATVKVGEEGLDAFSLGQADNTLVSTFAPLDFRNEDVRRKAAFHDTLDFASRIRRFREVIVDLEHQHKCRLEDHALVMKELAEYQHRLALYEREVDALEVDYVEARRRINDASDCRRLYQHAIMQVKLAEREREQADLSLVFAQQAALDAVQVHTELRDMVHSILWKRANIEMIMSTLRERAELTRRWAGDCRAATERAEDAMGAHLLSRRGSFIQTRFGLGKVLFVREDDSTACVDLPLGGGGGEASQKTPPLLCARMYISLNEIAERDKKSRKDERLRMELEENLTRWFVKIETRMTKAECRAFAAEEREQSHVEQFLNITSGERDIASNHAELALKKARIKLKTRQAKLELKVRTKLVIKQEEDKKAAEVGASRFGKQSSLERALEKMKVRRLISRQTKKSYLEEMVSQDVKALQETQAAEREKRVAWKVTDGILSKVLKDVIHKVCLDKVVGNIQSKEEALERENVILSQHYSLTAEAYNNLCDLRFSKKDGMRMLLRGTDFEQYVVPAGKNMEDICKNIDRRKRDDIEKARINKECELMMQEDSACREIYTLELKAALAERRMMAMEENHMKLAVKEEEMEEETRLKYDVIKGKKRLQPSVKMLRRTELKRGAAERQRVQKELAQMEIEDYLARQVRTEERNAEQKKMLQAEMDMLSGTLDEYESFDQLSSAVFVTRQKKYDILFLEHVAAELDWMERDDESNLCEQEVQANILRLNDLVAQSKEACGKELQAESLKKKMQQLWVSAIESDAMAIERMNGYKEKKALIEQDLEIAKTEEKWMDTYVLTGFHQRWPTTELRDHLKKLYFRRLSELIIFRAEVSLTSRLATHLKEDLSVKLLESKRKKDQMKALHSKHRRKEFLSLRRSVLAKKIFGAARKNKLVNTLQRWRFFTQWHRGYMRAFQLKTAAYDNQFMVDNILSHLVRNRHSEETLITSPVRSTILEGHKSRQIECRKCKTIYTENHNHQSACQFHTGQLISSIELGKGLWSCCNRGNNDPGCAYSFHVPFKDHFLISTTLKRAHDFIAAHQIDEESRMKESVALEGK